MKINFDAFLIHLDGKPLTDKNGDVNLKTVAVESLMVVIESDRTTKGEVKFMRYKLAEKVNSGGEVELTPEEAAMLKQRIGDVFGTAVVGPAFKLLNG
jgi:hypothetical protein